MPNTNNKEIDVWSSDLRQLIGEIVITMGTEKGEKLVAEIKNKVHQELQKARPNWLREEIVKLEGMKRFRFLDNVAGVQGLNRAIDARNEALQTIIDRYQSELDQPIS